MSGKVQRSLYIHLGKHELIFNLIKIEYYEDYNHVDAVKITVKESELANKFKYLIQCGSQVDVLKLLIETCYSKNLFKFKVLQLNKRDVRLKELYGLNINRPDDFFDDVIDTCLFDRLYETVLNLSQFGGR